MKKKFGKFWKDYRELYAVYGRFLKKHWIGVVIWTVAWTILLLASYCDSFIYAILDIGEWFEDTFEKIKTFFKRKFHKA